MIILHDMPLLATTLGHHQTLTPTCGKGAAWRHRQLPQRLRKVWPQVAATGRSSGVLRPVRLRLELLHTLIFSPSSPAFVVRFACSPLYSAGDDVRRAKLSEALEKLTQRILTFPEGKHEPSAPVQLLHQLTDEILVLAADAVEKVMAKQQPRPSGKAQFRLLAWMVADARGATTLLEKALAETVGKRLDRQAQKVRGDISAVRAAAREARLRATGDTDDRAATQPLVAAIDADERTKLQSLREEVYVGFHELESLLPGFEAEELDDSVAESEHEVLAAARRVAEAEARRPPRSSSVPSIPTDLARRLGPEGVQYLWNHTIGRRGSWRPPEGNVRVLQGKQYEGESDCPGSVEKAGLTLVLL